MLQKTQIKDISLGFALYAAQWFPIWFIIGSFHKSFSGLTIAGSLAGLYVTPGGLYTWFFVSLMRFMMRNSYALPLQLLSVYHIPTQVAAWYWKIFGETLEKKRTLRFFFATLPFICMGLFIAHPVGCQAAPYTFYWIIPACIALMPNPHRWLCALGSTFTAHALGSVLWLWTHPDMTASMWLDLIPVVAYERILLATAVWVSAYFIDWCAEKARLGSLWTYVFPSATYNEAL